MDSFCIVTVTLHGPLGSQRFILELNPIMALCPHSPRGEKGESTIISNLSEPDLDQKRIAI